MRCSTAPRRLPEYKSIEPEGEHEYHRCAEVGKLSGVAVDVRNETSIATLEVMKLADKKLGVGLLVRLIPSQ